MSPSAASPVTENRPEPRQAGPLDPSSLCANCDHADGCALPRASLLPILHCEEWEAAGAAPLAPVAQFPVKEAAAMTKPAAPPVKGLCATCESFPTCAFVKPDEGIWHCEEYA